MKKCDYCGKQISYSEQYCCDECSQKALKYYHFERKYKNIFGFFNIICAISVMAACFLSLLLSAKIGYIVSGAALTLLGAAVVAFPMPTLNQIKKQKIQKAVFSTRIIGGIISFSGICLLIVGLFVV